MTERFNQPEHDAIVRASANTYNQLVQQGYKVAINPGTEHNQFVGPSEHRVGSGINLHSHKHRGNEGSDESF
jgi:hypothetical protein